MLSILSVNNDAMLLVFNVVINEYERKVKE